MAEKYRTRFAPSPTGYLHVGGARTALYNFIVAKKNNGKFIIRIEDTDKERSTIEAVDSLINDIKWLGLYADEGFTAKSQGDMGPYKQSERLDIYKKYANTLLEQGKAYYCFLTDEEIEQQREVAISNKIPFHVNSPYRDMNLEEAKEKISLNQKATIRLKTPDSTKDYIFQDLIRGSVKLPSSMIGDFVIIRSCGMPVYNFCCVIDDALMEISHVLRGEEHLSNTLRQLMIYEALNLEIPQFAHLSIILNEQHKKLSKRDGGVSCNSFKEKGYLAAALLNYIALLGWTDPSGDEILSLDQLIERFEISDLNSSAPVFDIKKLNWVNSQHIHRLSNDELYFHINPFLEKENIKLPTDKNWLNTAAELIRPELVTLDESPECFNIIFNKELELQSDCAEYLDEKSLEIMSTWNQLILDVTTQHISIDQFNEFVKQISTQCDVKGKKLFMTLRVAVTAKTSGFDLKTLVSLVEVKTLQYRVAKILKQYSH